MQFYKVQENIDWHLVKRFVTFCALLIAFIILLTLFFSPILVPIFLSFLFAYLLIPIVNRFTRHRSSRGPISLGIIVLFVALFTFASYRILPLVYYQILDLLNLVPEAVRKTTSIWIPSIRDFVVTHDILDQETFDELVKNASIMTQISNQIRQAVTTIWNSAPQVLGTVVNLVLVPPLTFFLLKDMPVIEKHLATLIPRDLQFLVLETFRGINKTLRTVIKGHATVAAILAVLYVLGFSIVGLQSAIAIGLVAGLCRIVPYLDVVVGGILSIIVLVPNFTGWGQVLAIIGVFTFVQSLDGMYITPRVVGERVGLHPMIVILSVFAFADMLGIWGILIAIPAIALIKDLWHAIVPYYLGSRAYQPVALKSNTSKNINELSNSKPNEQK
ncbi:MAG: AI-2E family transporter [Bdellovibrionota bacterium]